MHSIPIRFPTYNSHFILSTRVRSDYFGELLPVQVGKDLDVLGEHASGMGEVLKLDRKDDWNVGEGLECREHCVGAEEEVV